MPALSILHLAARRYAVSCGALGLGGAPRGERTETRLPGALALLGALAALASRSATSPTTQPGTRGLQHVTDVVWISELGIHYKLGIDGLNVFLIGLTTLLFARRCSRPTCATWERPRLFYFYFMLAESAVLGAFLAQDLALFVAFFDLMLIPFYFLIGHVGRRGPERVRATIKLVIYTLVGSLLMLAGGDRHRRAGLPAERRPHHVRALTRCRRCR